MTDLALQPGPADATPLQAVPAYPASRSCPPEPWPVPFPLKGLGSARFGAETLADGRRSYWIEHDTVRGVTPRMLAWWFAHLEGDVVIAGRRVNRYRAWHPYDHVHASYARRCPDGSIGPGAQIRLREFLNGDPRYPVHTVTTIEKLDEEGFIHNPSLHGIPGLVRMEYRFERVAGGTRYVNRLLIGGIDGWRRAISPFIQRFGFGESRGQAWLRHNIEEVGLFEHILPPLYRQETGLQD
ncbi:DAPG hydrolase family protein [Aquabacterium humicola]|uniref:DAPG hydrolase family protein n=1 Tax=Aquabacterium humicola TaxID=3237377 RepID=UPI002543C33F|nr:hypothetical protein [Rubrivivax pictus]